METNTNNAAISIIIPHWENIDGLEILLESIQKETNRYPNLVETIVIDDYSSQGTQQKLRNLQNRFDFRLYFNNSIKSAGTCRNIGIENSTGQWLLFADSDDYFLPNFLDATQKYLNSDYDIVYFPPTSVYYNNHNIVSNRHISYILLLENYKRNPRDELALRYKWIPVWSRLIRKKFVINNNIKCDTVLAYNDVSFSTHIGFYAKKIVVDTNTIYVVTTRKGSLTHNPTVNHLLSRIEVLIMNNRFLTNHKLCQFKKAYLKWLLHILVYFGFYEFLKAIIFIMTQKENPLLNFTNEIAIMLLNKKRRKHMFKKLIFKILKKRNFIS